ncbi:MAG: DNA methyltransferase [Nanoarchaeota archaeon]
MKEYLFVMGRDPQLSIIELVSYLEARKIQFRVRDYTAEVSLIEAPSLNIASIIKELGGTTKIGVIFDLKTAKFLHDKIKYHIESYESDISKFKEELKKVFKEERVRGQFKNIKGPQDLAKHKILHEGFEFLLFKDKVFKTEAVSNPRSYQDRDLKPYFDEKRTTSVRLVRIMINIAGLKPGDTLLDPYCGTGTVMQEAIILGIKATGLDLDKLTCEGCKRNLHWIRKKYQLRSEWHIINKDAKRLATYVDKVDGVVTEPYLGPFLKKLPTYNSAKKLIDKLTKEYHAVLKQIKLVNQGRTVIVLPVYHTNDGRIIKLPFMELLKKEKFKLYHPIKGFEIPIKYHPPNTKLGREIYILTN